MAYSIIQHLSYNEWANTRIADLLLAIDDNLYFQVMKSSFPSLAKTVLHIADSQQIWLRRMQGENITAWPSANFQGTKRDSLLSLIQSSKDLVTFITSKDESFLSTPYSYKNLKGEPCTDPVEDTLFHIVNHNSYHRGQIITMLRELNVAPLVSTDLIHYLRSLK
jgi:uncharacterized damage-inducible protein DinB